MSQPLQICRNPALGPDEHRRRSEFYAEQVTGWDTKDREAFEALVAAMPLRGRQLVAPPLAGGADWPVLIRWGRELPFNNLVVRRMSANECHQNSAELWADSMACTDEGVGSTLRIETGFALSDDRLWREHTWVRDMSGGGEGTLIETTQARVAYWGIALTQQGSFVFAAEQLGYAPVPETADDRTRGKPRAGGHADRDDASLSAADTPPPGLLAAIGGGDRDPLAFPYHQMPFLETHRVGDGESSSGAVFGFELRKPP